MDITLPANRWRIYENLRNRLDRGRNVRLRLLFGLELFLRLQRDCGQHCSSQGAKIFGAEIVPGYFPQVFIHVLRCDVANLLVVIHVLKQILSGKVLELGNDLRDAPISHIHFVVLSALAAKTEAKLRSLYFDMPVFHGSETE